MKALRNEQDYDSLAVPPKYRRLGDFHRYYAGEKTAPILTLVIGGNHEAGHHMFYGGWLAPNMYYLGTAGCVRVAGLVIAGASGIYKSHDYMRGHYERVPFSPSDVRSAYHTRQYEITKLALLPRPDIFLSHDWPNGIEQYGDVASLLRRKPFFRDEIRTSTLGSPPLQTLLHDLKPRYWFAAHLHVEFHARVDHGGRPAQAAPPLQANPEAIAMDDLSDDDSMAPSQAAHDTPSPLTPSTTEFLALGKCTRHGGYLHNELSSANGRPNVPLTYDPTWLAITRVLDDYFPVHRTAPRLPLPTDARLRERVADVTREFQDGATTGRLSLDVRATQAFERTVPTQAEWVAAPRATPSSPPPNTQTEALCRLIGVSNRVETPRGGTSHCPPEDLARQVEKIRHVASTRKRKHSSA